MGDENTHIPGATITVGETETSQETPFDRLEERIDTLIERYEHLLSEHNHYGEELAVREARIRELEVQLEQSEQLRLEARNRLDALIDKLARFS